MTYPIPGVAISTPYGKRGSYWSCNPDSSGNGIHTGVDFACPSGTDIVAPIPGQIRHRSYGSAFGSHQFVISPDPGQFAADGEVFFAHTTNRPPDGVYVEVGDYLADVGAEGNVSGPHLHMEYHPTTKGSWSCSVVADPQAVLDYQAEPPAPDDPTNPNNVQVGEKVMVTANGSLNGRSGPGGEYPVVTTLPEGATLVVEALQDGWASDTAQSAVSAAEAATEPLVPVYGTDYLHGWDISSHQGAEWQPADNETFGWVKCTEGKTYLNPDYDEQIVMARSRDQVVGHYHWLNDGDVTAQVSWFKTNADVLPGEMIAVDWEDPSNPTTAQKDEAIDQLQAAYPNNRVGLYCNKDWWINHDTSSFYGDYLWIANYGPDKDEGPGIKAQWFFWQYTSSPYDKNYGAFASVDVLRDWAHKGETPPPDPTYVGSWFSTDYLDQYAEPPSTKPGWKSTPRIVLPMTDVPGSVSYLQGVALMNAVTDASDGKDYAQYWMVGQDYDNAGDLRFLCFRSNGEFSSWMQVNDGGHGQTFHAYRSAAGNPYVWCGENPAYRYAYVGGGKKVAKSSGDKMDYGGARPMGGYGADRVAFRDATDTKETFTLWDRTDFTDGSNRTTPLKKVTVTKRTDYTQQSWAANESRIYRIMGHTNEDAGAGSRRHIIDVFDWSGELLLDRFDITDMHRSGCTEDEPEGLCCSEDGTTVYAFKREGPASASKRAYVGWELTGMP